MFIKFKCGCVGLFTGTGTLSALANRDHYNPRPGDLIIVLVCGNLGNIRFEYDDTFLPHVQDTPYEPLDQREVIEVAESLNWLIQCGHRYHQIRSLLK